jgi:hypothetical protein
MRFGVDVGTDGRAERNDEVKIRRVSAHRVEVESQREWLEAHSKETPDPRRFGATAMVNPTNAPTGDVGIQSVSCGGNARSGRLAGRPGPTGMPDPRRFGAVEKAAPKGRANGEVGIWSASARQ